MEWQPIETAPRDGTPVLAATSRSQYVAWNNGRSDMWVFVDDGRGNSFFFRPTHWMPLPPPPATQEPRR